ncbi:PCM1 [Bugula neritina]|uniref:PCM1 n=1 Tax=Bugula neritina TaxID=10212 RepID=A0A7J7KGB3_BUGNE|nr:PCM1 [Bugula neritina]
MYKPGVSSGICGTSYADNTSISSAVSSAVSSVRGESYKDRTNSTPTKFTDAAGSDPLSSALAALAKERLEDSAASDYSLFEALRETIYSEVATLISQNENRPHFLIQLFRELQMLSSDYLRQRVLYSVQELVTKFLTGEIFDVKGNKDESDNEVLAPQPAWMVYRTAGSEETPTESCVTTDDELRQSLPRVNSVSTEEKLKKFIDSSRGSISCDFADYIEHVETTSTHSTSQSQTGSMRDDPFNQDSLGDTVIHLEKEHSHRGGAQVPAAASHSGSSLGVAGVPWALAVSVVI